MLHPTLEQIIPELRDAIGPVILISGVGLLLLTMTNRLGRAIDRSRQLKQEFVNRTGEELEQTRSQVKILYRRATIIRLCIILAASSASLASILIVALFVGALFQIDFAWFVGLTFVACMLSLLFSMIAFIIDINLSLVALRLELESVLEKRSSGRIHAKSGLGSNG
jgi:hypothetical protein